MKNVRIILYAVIISFTIFSCGTETQKQDEVLDFIEISNQQFIENEMQLGKIETRVFENIVKSTGVVTPVALGNAKISAPLKGLITNIFFENGQFVKKNQILFEIGGNEIIDLQKEYAVVSANLKRLKADYNRIKILHNENAVAEKDFIQTEAEYKAKLSEYNGLKLKIQIIGLSPDRIEEGIFQTSYVLKSPIDGYVYNLKSTIGTDVGVENELLEILNPELLQIQLSVFPNDISKISIGQSVRIKMGGSPDIIDAKITAVGVSIDNVSKSIPCFAAVSEIKTAHLISNMYVEADIITHKDTIHTLQKSAVINAENKYYILVLTKTNNDKYIFEKQEVIIGIEQNNFVEILENITTNQILIQGGYYLNLNE